MGKITVCIADDNRELVHIMEDYLNEQHDIEVIGVAFDGRKCIELMEEHDPDILILDIIMPHKDGLAVLQTVTREKSEQFSSILLC